MRNPRLNFDKVVFAVVANPVIFGSKIWKFHCYPTSFRAGAADGADLGLGT
jgi:hypothetical protein